MEKLQATLAKLIERFDDPVAFRARLKSLVSVYPFSEYEYIISYLLAQQKLSTDEYELLRQEYIDRNLYLSLFEISAPRGFGDTWGVGQILQLAPPFKRPSKKTDPAYSGEYDLWLPPEIKTEVKASRAVDFERPSEPLYVKALNSHSTRPFDMDFQQLKPGCCHVFIWIAVWRDAIRYWVLNSEEVRGHKDFSAGQHRGNVGEGQLHVTQDNIHTFNQYEVQPNQIEQAVRQAYQRLKSKNLP
jgi:hypothetical protein